MSGKGPREAPPKLRRSQFFRPRRLRRRRPARPAGPGHITYPAPLRYDRRPAGRLRRPGYVLRPLCVRRVQPSALDSNAPRAPRPEDRDQLRAGHARVPRPRPPHRAPPRRPRRAAAAARDHITYPVPLQRRARGRRLFRPRRAPRRRGARGGAPPRRDRAPRRGRLPRGHSRALELLRGLVEPLRAL